MKQGDAFEGKVEELARLRKPRIAFGLAEAKGEILESLRRSLAYADIVLVGPEAIRDVSGFSVIVDEDPEIRITTMLVQKEVDGIVRGTIDDFKTREAYERATGERPSPDNAPLLVEDATGRRFFLSPGSNPQGWTKEDRLAIVEKLDRFGKEWCIPVKVAVLTGVRHETYARKKMIREGATGILNVSYEDAEWIVAELGKRGIEAKNWSIDSDRAVQEGYTVLLPVNGMVGNQMFRMILLSGGKILIGTYFGLSYWYEDNSRNETDYDFHIRWLAALINKRHGEMFGSHKKEQV